MLVVIAHLRLFKLSYFQISFWDVLVNPHPTQRVVLYICNDMPGVVWQIDYISLIIINIGLASIWTSEK